MKMVMSHSYVSLPEGNYCIKFVFTPAIQPSCQNPEDVPKIPPKVSEMHSSVVRHVLKDTHQPRTCSCGCPQACANQASETLRHVPHGSIESRGSTRLEDRSWVTTRCYFLSNLLVFLRHQSDWLLVEPSRTHVCVCVNKTMLEQLQNHIIADHSTGYMGHTVLSRYVSLVHNSLPISSGTWSGNLWVGTCIRYIWISLHQKISDQTSD